MRKKSAYKRQPAPKAEYKVYTKLQLIKKLKADDNYNWDFVKTLNDESDYIYERGYAHDVYSLSPRGQEGAWKRIQAIVNDVKEEFPEPALERKRQYELEYIIDTVDRHVQTDDVSAVQLLLSTILKDAPTQDLLDYKFENLKYELTAEEYISISVRASVWSYYIKGSLILNGNVYSAKGISYRPSEANRL